MVLVFDLNGTLLDTRALEPHLHRIFRGRLTAREWFGTVLQYAASISLAGDYRPFHEIAAAVLEMKADGLQVRLEPAVVQRVQDQMKNLPAFAEARSALESLRKANFRMAVLTNATRAAMQQQLENAGLGSYFEQTLSVDQVRRYKPARDPYELAMRSLGTSPDHMLMVAAHPWDLLGAHQAGCKTAFIRRPGNALLPGAPPPTYVAKDLADLATQLGARSGARSRSKSAAVVAAAVLAGTYVAVRQRGAS